MRRPRLLYRDPLGSTRAVSSADELHEIICSPKADYWKVGSGDAELQFSSRSRESCLGIMYKTGHGFCLMHNYLKDSDETDDMYVAVTGKGYQRKTSVFVGGDFFRFPAAFFLSVKLAWEAIAEFCESGCRCNRLTWQRRKDIHAFDEDEEIHGKPY